MAAKETICYAAFYAADCEVCGKRFTGTAEDIVRGGDGTSMLEPLLSNGTQDLLNYAEAKLAKKRLEENSKYPPYSDIYFTRECCPYCGARQSWRPLKEPKQPAKPGGAATCILCAFILGIIGMLLGLFIYIFTESVLAILIPAGLGVLGGIFGGRSINKSSAESDRKDYEKAKENYEKDLLRYEQFQQELAKRTVRNRPEIDLSTGRFKKFEILP